MEVCDGRSRIGEEIDEDGSVVILSVGQTVVANADPVHKYNPTTIHARASIGPYSVVTVCVATETYWLRKSCRVSLIMANRKDHRDPNLLGLRTPAAITPGA